MVVTIPSTKPTQNTESSKDGGLSKFDGPPLGFAVRGVLEGSSRCLIGKGIVGLNHQLRNCGVSNKKNEVQPSHCKHV